MPARISFGVRKPCLRLLKAKPCFARGGRRVLKSARAMIPVLLKKRTVASALTHCRAKHGFAITRRKHGLRTPKERKLKNVKIRPRLAHQARYPRCGVRRASIAC